MLVSDERRGFRSIRWATQVEHRPSVRPEMSSPRVRIGRPMRRFFTTAAALGLLASCLLGQDTSSHSNQTISSVRLWISDKQVKSVQGSIPSGDLMKELNAKCDEVVLTDNEEKADYRLEAGYAWCCTPRGESRGYKFALFNKDGDAISSTKTHTLGNAVKDICVAIGRGKGKMCGNVRV
jgi:hypothetical protein